MPGLTLADVARACGTSPSTVSRALSDPGKVRASTRDRIERVARELGYTPHRAAQSLSLGRTGTLGLIVPDIANPFFPPIIKAVQARAGVHGRGVLLVDTDENAADEIPRARAMREQADGLIVVSPRTPDHQLGELCSLEPLVLINRQAPQVPCVTIESAEGIHQAVEHLTALGHRSIAYLNGPRRSWSNAQRRRSIAAACQSQQVQLIEFGPFEPELQAGARAADLLHASSATAAVAYDDLIALGLMARLSERQLEVGHDVSVIGIDDAAVGGVCYPTLTSIHVPGAKAGATAVDLLVDRIDDGPGSSRSRRAPGTGDLDVTLETHLVVRGSTGPAPR